MKKAQAEGRTLDAFRQGGWLIGWGRAEAGYEWVDTGLEAVLMPKDLGLDEEHLYPPLTVYTPIHRVFWKIYKKHTPGEELLPIIVKVADQHGLLGVKKMPVCVPVELTGDGGDKSLRVFEVEGEPFSEWVRAIGTIGRLVDLWEMIKEVDLEELEQTIVWDEKRELFWWAGKVAASWSCPREIVTWDSVLVGANGHARDCSWSPEGVAWEPLVVVEGGSRPPLRHSGSPRRQALLLAARTTLSCKLNELLDGAVSPAVLVSADEKAKDKDSVRFDGVLRPRSLLAIAGLQFWWEVTGTRRYRECEGPGCDEWFDTSYARNDWRYCSVRCRKRASRAKEARDTAGTNVEVDGG